MNFTQHSELDGKHAMFSPSQNAWVNYDDAKLIAYIIANDAKNLGTELHEFAAINITERSKLPKSKRHLIELIRLYFSLKKAESLKTKSIERVQYYQKMLHLVPDIPDRILITLTEYTNDAIGFGMTPEVKLKYSDVCYGTADAIMFRDKKLRIHDFKSGEHRASIVQLELYAALFCLEYKITPADIETELCIYQNEEKNEEHPAPDRIMYYMNRIVNVSDIAMKRHQGVII